MIRSRRQVCLLLSLLMGSWAGTALASCGERRSPGDWHQVRQLAIREMAKRSGAIRRCSESGLGWAERSLDALVDALECVPDVIANSSEDAAREAEARVRAADAIVFADNHCSLSCQRAFGRLCRTLTAAAPAGRRIVLLLEAVPHTHDVTLRQLRAACHELTPASRRGHIAAYLRACYPYPTLELAAALADDVVVRADWVAAGRADLHLWTIDPVTEDHAREPIWLPMITYDDWKDFDADGNQDLRRAIDLTLDQFGAGAVQLVVLCGAGHACGDPGSVARHLESRLKETVVLTSGLPEFECAVRSGFSETRHIPWLRLKDTIYWGPLLEDGE